MQEIFKSKTREPTMDLSIGTKQYIIETGIDPVPEITNSDFSIHVRRPGYREGVHPITELQYVGGKCTVFPSTAWNDTIIVSSGASVTAAEFPEFRFPSLPINFGFLHFGVTAGGAHPLGVKPNRGLSLPARVFEFNSGIGALI